MTFGRALEEGIKDKGSDSHGWNILPDLSLRTRYSDSRTCVALLLYRTFTPVAADGSRRHFQCGKNAPTAVGGYSLLANHAKHELSGLFTDRKSTRLNSSHLGISYAVF